jgi:Tfp pilus assembly PilM family ATPase
MVLKKITSFFKDKTVIGLDIGNESIKMVEVLRRDDGTNELLTYGIARHGVELSEYWDSGKLRQISIIVEDIMRSGGFVGVKTVISLQSKDVYVTTLDFDNALTKIQIQEEITKQAPYFLPYAPEDMRMSWTFVEEDEKISQFSGKQRVIINALPDFIIDNSKNLLEHVNLDGAALENQTVSQIRASLSHDSGNTVLMDVGGHYTTFSILIDGILRSSSHVNFGTDKIQQDLSQYLGVDTTTAESFKRDLNLVNLYFLPPQVTETLSILKSELKTFVQLNKKVSQTPQKVLVNGGGVLTPGFMEYFKDFEVPVFQADNLRKLFVPESLLPYVLPISSQLATAIGLALREEI